MRTGMKPLYKIAETYGGFACNRSAIQEWIFACFDAGLAEEPLLLSRVKTETRVDKRVGRRGLYELVDAEGQLRQSLPKPQGRSDMQVFLADVARGMLRWTARHDPDRVDVKKAAVILEKIAKRYEQESLHRRKHQTPQEKKHA